MQAFKKIILQYLLCLLQCYYTFFYCINLSSGDSVNFLEDIFGLAILFLFIMFPILLVVNYFIRNQKYRLITEALILTLFSIYYNHQMFVYLEAQWSTWLLSESLIYVISSSFMPVFISVFMYCFIVKFTVSSRK